MQNETLENYVTTAIAFINEASSTRDHELRIKATSATIANVFKKEPSAIEKTLRRTIQDSHAFEAEYRVSDIAKDSVQSSTPHSIVEGDQGVSAGARLIIGDTMYDRSADSIISSLTSSLEQILEINPLSK